MTEQRKAQRVSCTDIMQQTWWRPISVEIDLPGFKKDEVQVELKDGYLVVSAEKGLDEDEKDKKSGKYLRRERYAGSCQRSYYVGKDTTEDDIKAHFEHGMLTVTVAKKEAKPAVEEKKHIAIEG